MRIGIYSGSFNPIHIGHTSLADFIVKSGLVDEVWLMVTPLNPLKVNTYIESDEHRLAMAHIASQNFDGVKVSDFEFSLPQPTYTYHTLTELKKVYPEHDFRLIIGSDNWLVFERWRNWREIISDFGLLIYPRPGYEIVDTDLPENIILLADAPVYDISSTQIRQCISDDVNKVNLIHDAVYSYIKQHRLFIDSSIAK